MYAKLIDSLQTSYEVPLQVLDLGHHVFAEGHNHAIYDRELKEEPNVGMCQLIILHTYAYCIELFCTCIVLLNFLAFETLQIS